MKCDEKFCAEKNAHDYVEDEAHADEVECPECRGAGKLQCANCEGNGRSDVCGKCKGEGKVKCAACGGAGMNMDYDPPVKCSACEGSGWTECTDCEGTGRMICDECDGEGAVSCEGCNGTGYVHYRVATYDSAVFDRISGEVRYAELLANYGKAGRVLVRAAKNGDVDAAYILSAALDEVETADRADILSIARKSKFGQFREAVSFLGVGEYEKALLSFEEFAKNCFVPANGYIALLHHLGVLGLNRDQKEVAKYCRMYCDSTKKLFAPSVCGSNLIEFMTKFPRAINGDNEAIVGLGRILRQWKIEDVTLSEKVQLTFYDCSSEWYFRAWKSAPKHNRKAVIEECLAALHEMADKGSRVAKICIAKVEGMSTEKSEVEHANFSPLQQGVKTSDTKPKDIDGGQPDRVEAKKTQKKTVPTKSLKNGERSSKKRWKFVLLGLLFGWFGAHYMYAKRWLMLLLTLGSFATGVVMMNKSEASQKKEPAQTVQQPEGDVSKGNSEAIGAVCLVFWLVMWLGGALFVKKDGKGNRM